MLSSGERGIVARLHPSLAVLLVLLLALPSLSPVHRYPQTVFFNEWLALAALLGALAILMLSASRLLWRPAVAAGAALLGLALLLMSRDAGPVLLYGAFLWMAYAFGLAARRAWGEAVVSLFAAAFAVTALSQCLLAGLQLSALELSPWVMEKLGDSVFGNIAQRNHFADLLWIGQGSLLYLWLKGRLPGALAAVLMTVVSVFAALSASRSVWLFILAMPLLTALYWRDQHGPAKRRLVLACTALCLGAVLAQLWVSYGGVGQEVGVSSALTRMDSPHSNGQRLFDWQVALQTALTHPWRGSGLGSFAWQTAVASVGLPEPDFIRIGENAHNSVLHFLTETGFVLVVVLLWVMLRWLILRLREQATLESFWGLCVLMPIAAHSMVEYPLWYSYFLLPAGLAIGASSQAGRCRERFVRRRVLLLPLAVMLGFMLWTYHDYRHLERGYAIINARSALTAQRAAQADAAALRVASYSMFGTHAAILRLRAWQPDTPAGAGLAATMAQLCDGPMRKRPSLAPLRQCVAAYALENRRQDAEQMLAIICGAYPAQYRTDLSAWREHWFVRAGWTVPAKPAC